MKNKISARIWQIFIVVTALYGCEKDNQNTEPDVIPEKGYINGIYIVNEGPFMTGTGTIDFLTRDGKKYQNIYLTSNNGQVLGNMVQSIAMIGTKTYIVVNNDNKIEVVDSKTFQQTSTIENLLSPRYIISTGNSEAYVTCWGDNSVKIINLNGFEIIGSIPVNAPEKMLNLDNQQIWVLSQGGLSVDSTVSVIDVASKSILQMIPVYPQPSGIQMDKNGNIWVMCTGRNAWHPGGESEGHLVCINPLDYSLIKDIEFPDKTIHPEELEINGSKDILYYRYPGGIYKIGIDSILPETEPFISRSNGFYTISYDPYEDFIYGSDPLDYTQNGWIYKYNATNGASADSISAGIIPGEIYIMPIAD